MIFREKSVDVFRDFAYHVNKLVGTLSRARLTTRGKLDRTGNNTRESANSERHDKSGHRSPIRAPRGTAPLVCVRSRRRALTSYRSI